jgi:hypothetical protein
MADNALAKQVGKKMPERRKTRLEQIADEIQAYGGRVRDDFMAGAERSAQGLGDIVERGDVLTGIPRLALGGTAWMGAPVSAALSPILNPILQPVGEAVNTYVGQPVEDLTGYPADITNDLAMTGLTLGAVKGLGMTRPYLARAADQVEGMANRAGYTLRKPANVYGSGPTLTPLVDDEGFTVYHGTGKENADAINKGGFKIFGGTGVQDQFELPGISTTPNKSTAQFYAAGENYLTEADRMDPFVMELRVSGSKSLYPSLSKAEKEFQGAGGNISDIPAFLQFLKGRGYKGVTHDGEVRVFDPADIKVVGGQPMQYQDGRLVNGSGPTLTPLVNEADGGLIAYHGSPHTFDKFSMDKIGTGEGAQAYGHGLYFADNEATARSYRDVLSANRAPSSEDLAKFSFDDQMKISDAIQAAGEKAGFNTASPDAFWLVMNRLAGKQSKTMHPVHDRAMLALDEVEKYVPEDIKSLISQSVTPAKGSMYQVKINVKPDELLDWDKPLSEQPQAVRDALKARKTYDEHKGRDYYNSLVGRESQDAPLYYTPDAAETWAAPRVSESLKSAGIKGIRYKDAVSRSAEGGTHNYVIFDDSLIDILKRYGIPMTAAAGGGMMVMGQDMPPEVASQIGG